MNATVRCLRLELIRVYLNAIFRKRRVRRWQPCRECGLFMLKIERCIPHIAPFDEIFIYFANTMALAMSVEFG